MFHVERIESVSELCGTYQNGIGFVNERAANECFTWNVSNQYRISIESVDTYRISIESVDTYQNGIESVDTYQNGIESVDTYQNGIESV